MPPKGWKKYADGFKPATSSGLPAEKRPEYGIEDLLLPRSTISKLIRECLPPGMALPRDVVTALMRAATVFISYLCADANTVCQSQGHKIVTPANIETALEHCGFGVFVASVKEMTERTVARVAAAKKQKQQISQAETETEVDTNANVSSQVPYEDIISSDSEPEELPEEGYKKARVS